MARIQLRDVSYHYPVPLQGPVSRIFKTKRREHLQEDMPVKTSKGVAAWDHVNLTIPSGQTYVVVGPSGCGKSTLLRVVAGITRDYTGQVSYDGEDVKSMPPGDRYIGMVFQNYALYPNFNSEGNLTFFFKIHEINDEETRRRIEFTSEMMGIGFKDLLPRKPGTLSDGEKQRVAIARAIVRAPRLFLFDEPLSNLDAKLRLKTRAEIKRLLHQFKITSIYVTHDQVEAVALADMIVVMHAGRIEQLGTYKELTEDPASLFVAGFLGLPPMDLYPSGSISGGRLVLSDYAFPLPSRIHSIVHDGQQVILGTRREDVKVSAEEIPGEMIQFRAEVEAAEPDLVHRQQIVHIRMGNILYSGLSSMDEKLHPGQLIHVAMNPERLYFFDTVSGKRI